MEQTDKEMLLNPLNSVKPNGILGFRIGDTKEEVFSRIKTLGLLNDGEIMRGKQSVAAGIENVGIGDLLIGKDMFSEISSIQLNINCFGLKTITVNIKCQQSITPQQQLEQFAIWVISITGKMPKPGSLFWDLDNNNLSLYYINSNEICLEFDKHLY